MKKRLGITGKLVLSSACIFVGLGLAVTWYSAFQFRSLLYREMVFRVEAQSLSWIEANTAQIILSPDPPTLERLMSELRQRRGFAYVILSDAGKKQLALSGAPAGLAEERPAQKISGIRSRLTQMVDAQRRRYFEVATLIPKAGTGLNPDLSAAFGVVSGDQILGEVRVGVDQAELGRSLGVFLPLNVLLFGALVLLALAVNVFLARRMVTPIAGMARVANQIAAGNLSERVQQGIELHDEVGELARDFNSMADRLAENRAEVERLYADLEEKVRERTRELEEANVRLQELDQLKSRFLSTVSHELRSPLTSIKAFAEILLDEPQSDPETRVRFLEIIDKETDRLSRLISDLLNLAKIESGRVSWRMREADLRRIIADAANAVASLAAERGVAIDQVQSEAQWVMVDADRIQQVVMNLLSNGIKFSPEGSRIEVRLDRTSVSGPRNSTPGIYARVAFEDRGPGIAPEDLERVFERFYQAGKDRASRPTGTGLGLTISREIVLHHGGEIWAESQSGSGSTFYFTVPLRS
ncbi:MAG: HAMP domain-containing protein [Acidobacteria bacterium]|nr:HAMP domain-containing protein [Acidobacteriota bacterium]